jgi:hypothetical protein
MIPMTVTIAGWTGDEAGPNGPSMDEYRRRLWAQLNADHPGLGQRYDAGDPTAKKILTQAGTDHLHGFFIAHAHRTAAPLANEYATVTVRAQRAVQQAAGEYADLSKNTTVNWLAAHHRFVITTRAARELLERCVDIAEDLHRHEQFLGGGGVSQRIYAAYVPAEHRITMPDLDDCKVQLASFVELSTERFTTTRATITGGYPAGFEPAPIEHEPFDRPTDDEVVWKNAAFPASTAVAATARNW